MHSNGVCLVGAQPPPVHGMAMVNAYIANRLTLMESHVVLVDLSPSSLSRRRLSRIWRIRKVFRGLAQSVMTRTSWSTMYIGLSGGVGQIYEIFFVILARCLSKRIFLHHHSFAYLDKPALITRLMTMMGGKSATHIVLCEKMGRTLKLKYPTVQRVFILSNTAVMEAVPRDRVFKSKLQTIGYLSNICKEKGIHHFLDVLESLYSQGISMRGIIAGPFQDDEIKMNVMNRISCLPQVEYVGPKYGEDKREFFSEIDILLFPTRYVNEAEPLTVYEALAEGVPVIAWDRGCISEMLPFEAGLVVGREDDFVKTAVKQIVHWMSVNEDIWKASQYGARYFEDMQNKWSQDYEKLLCLMTAKENHNMDVCE